MDLSLVNCHILRWGGFVVSDTCGDWCPAGMLCGGPLSSSQFPKPAVSIFVCSLFVCLRTSFYCRMHIIIQNRRWTLCKQQQMGIVKRKNSYLFERWRMAK